MDIIEMVMVKKMRGTLCLVNTYSGGGDDEDDYKGDNRTKKENDDAAAHV